LEFPPLLKEGPAPRLSTLGLILQRRYLIRVAKLVTHSLHQHPVRLALSTGIVSAFFSVLYQAIEEFLSHPPHDQLKELIVIAVTSIGMLLAIEPILERISPVRARRSSHRKDTALIQTGAFLTIVATSLLHGLLHAHISESLSVHGMIVLEQLVTALVAPTLITLAWLYGVRRERPQARWYGLMAGLLVGLGLVSLAMLQLYFLRPPAEIREASSHEAAMALLVVAASLLWFVVPTCAVNGYLGGLAADRQWCATAWRGIAVGLLMAAAVEAGSFLLASSVESQVIKAAALIRPEMLLSLLGEVTIANLGWSMGLWVNPDADALLRSASPGTSSRDRKREATAGLISAAAMLAVGTLLSLAAIALASQAGALLR
jgi:hypothetical protein